MTDCFALLDLPRRPALDAEHLKENYFRLAARLHPDASTGDATQFATLVEALKTLEDPATRLRHLAELHFPDAATTSAHPLKGDLFLQVGGALQQVKAFTEKSAAAKSALLKALLTEEKAAAFTTLAQVKAAVQAAAESAARHLAELDSRWPEVPALELLAMASEWSYLGKWQGELSEWEFRLAQA